MYRNNRHNKILELIRNRQIETQEEMAEELIADGYKVTQATVSRDIKELGLVKISAPDGKQYYAKEMSPRTVNGKVIEIAHSVIVNSSVGDKLIVLKTIEGFGKIAKSAVEELSENLGCIADEDTVFISFKDANSCNVFYNKLKAIIY